MGHRFAIMDPPDSLGDHDANIDNLEFGAPHYLVPNGRGVADHHLVDIITPRQVLR